MSESYAILSNEKVHVMRILASLSFVILALSTSNLHAQGITIDTLLFPESKTWRIADTIPALPPGRLTSTFAESLWDEMDRNNRYFSDSPGCMMSMRLFFSPGTNALFHPIDLGDPRGPGLFYSGDAQCEEGNVTIVWSNPATYKSAKAEEAPVRLLRIESAKDPRSTAVQVGCCGDPVDVYLISKLTHLNLQQRWYVEKELQIPRGTRPAHEVRSFDAELVIRSSPSMNDVFQPDRSHFLDKAAFGNIERRYLPGTAVTVIAKWQSPSGSVWDLVEVPDDANNYLTTYEATAADVGWTTEKR